MSVSVANFVKHIVINLLEKNLTSKDYKYLGGSQNTLRQCVERNKGIGESVIEIISNLIIDETKFNQSKRNQILDYLKQFLTLNEKSYCNRNPEDIKTILKLACKNLVKSKNEPKKEQFRIVDMDDLIKIGWSIEDMMKTNSNLAYETINNLKEEHVGGLEQWFEIYRRKSDTIRSFLDSDNNVIGYWHFQPLCDKMFIKAKNGKLMESEIITKNIPPMLSGTYNIYFISICLKEEHRRKYKIFKKLFYSIIDVFEDFARNDIFINEICALAYTDEGVSLCERIGLRYITKHIECGDIYCGKMINLLNNDFCQDYIGLKEMYKNKWYRSCKNKQ